MSEITYLQERDLYLLEVLRSHTTGKGVILLNSSGFLELISTWWKLLKNEVRLSKSNFVLHFNRHFYLHNRLMQIIFAGTLLPLYQMQFFSLSLLIATDFFSMYLVHLNGFLKFLFPQKSSFHQQMVLHYHVQLNFQKFHSKFYHLIQI